MKPQIMFKLILFSTLLITMLSCEKDNLFSEVVVDYQLSEKLYLESKDTLVIDNQKLILETDLYRDFTPGVTKNTQESTPKRGLIAPFSIVNIDSLPISKKFEIKKLYVINGDQIWISNPNAQQFNKLPLNKIFWISMNGPEWEPRIYVDVVVAIEDLNTSGIKYFIAKKQLISRIE